MSKEKPLMPASKVKLKGSCFLAKLKSFLEYKVKPFYNIHCKYIRCKKYTFFVHPEFPCTLAVFFTLENCVQVSAVSFVNYSKKVYLLH